MSLFVVILVLTGQNKSEYGHFSHSVLESPRAKNMIIWLDFQSTLEPQMERKKMTEKLLIKQTPRKVKNS